MATGPRYKVPFRRRRENRTDYYIRKKLLTSGETRAVVRRSSKNLSVQFARFTMEGDTIQASAASKELKALGWNHSCANIPAAYLTGYLAGKKAKEAGIEYAVLDIGMQPPSKGAVLFAAVAGMIDAGLNIPHGDGVLPPGDRLKGAHIGEDIPASVQKVLGALGGKMKDRDPKATKASKAAEEKKPDAKPAGKPAAGKKPDAKQTGKPAAGKKPDAKQTKKKGG
jgi:large subunit ribosomal protein L18